MDSAGLMAKLNPVPLGSCRRSWRERRHRTVPSAPYSSLVFDTGMYLTKMEVARSTWHDPLCFNPLPTPGIRPRAHLGRPYSVRP